MLRTESKGLLIPPEFCSMPHNPLLSRPSASRSLYVKSQQLVTRGGGVEFCTNPVALGLGLEERLSLCLVRASFVPSLSSVPDSDASAAWNRPQFDLDPAPRWL